MATKSNRARPVPQSTNVSSPVRARNKGKGKEVAYNDDFIEDDEGFGEDMGRGATRVPALNHSLDEDYEEDEDNTFQPIPPRRRQQPNRQGPRELGAPILRDAHHDGAVANEMHDDLVANFLHEAKALDSKLRDRDGIRRAIFSETELREMVLRWTTSVVDVASIPDIDQEKVEKYGVKFADLVLRFKVHYDDVMKTMKHNITPAQHMVAAATLGNDEIDEFGGMDIENRGITDEPMQSDMDEGFEISPHFQPRSPSPVIDPSSEYYHPPNDPTLDPDTWIKEYERLTEASINAAPGRSKEEYERSKRKSETSRNAWKNKSGSGSYRKNDSVSPSHAGPSAGVTKRKSSGSRAPARGRGGNKNGNSPSGIATMPH